MATGEHGETGGREEQRVLGVGNFYHFRFQKDVRSVELQGFSQGWKVAGWCVWKHDLDTMMICSFIPAALEEKGVNWGLLSNDLYSNQGKNVCVFAHIFLLEKLTSPTSFQYLRLLSSFFSLIYSLTCILLVCCHQPDVGLNWHKYP